MIVLLSFATSLLLCLLLASRYSPLKVMDTPNERSLHETPTPRSGGIGIMLTLFFCWGLQGWSDSLPELMLWIVGASLMVAAISFIDDLCELSALLRLAVHGIAAVLLIAGGLVMFDGWPGLLMTWFAVVWMLNLYNFMDGMDGFAGGMTLLGFGFLAIAGWAGGSDEYAHHALLVAAAALGFLVVNFPPARIFMGDVGSATLGLLAAAFGLWGIREGLFAWWFPLLVFSPFIVDATVTLIRRMLNRERIWEAHRSHYYQRLVQLGWGHKKTVLAEYGVMMLSGLTALMALQLDSPLTTAAVLAGWCCIYLFVAISVQRMESGEWK